MEIANIFVVNKADRVDAEGLYRNLRILAHEKANGTDEIPVIKTIATEDNGIDTLACEIKKFLADQKDLPEKRLHLITEKCWQLIQAQRMKDINHNKLKHELALAIKKEDFNLYAFTNDFLNRSAK